jgi:integrase
MLCNGAPLPAQLRGGSRLPQPLADMCLLKVNTGLRADEVCGLRWAWEVRLEDGGSVFAIPPAAHKGGDYGRYRLVVLNSVAQRVVEAQRGGTRSSCSCRSV